MTTSPYLLFTFAIINDETFIIDCLVFNETVSEIFSNPSNIERRVKFTTVLLKSLPDLG